MYKLTIKLKDGTLTTVRNEYLSDTVKVARLLLDYLGTKDIIRTMIISKYPLKQSQGIAIVENYIIVRKLREVKEVDILK